MKVEKTALPGVLVITPRIFRDDRGFFLESFNRKAFAEHGLPVEFVQDNHSRSVRNVVRGLHYQLTHPQGKLVRVTRGRVYDVAVDIRPDSRTFGRWNAVELSDETGTMVWIPVGFAHGFCALSDVADVAYKLTALYDPPDERGIRWNDPALGIPWPVDDPIVSAKDQLLPSLYDRTDLPVIAG